VSFCLFNLRIPSIIFLTKKFTEKSSNEHDLHRWLIADKYVATVLWDFLLNERSAMKVVLCAN
jgi:hypothetical protein